MQKNGMVNGVKGSRKIKKTEASDLLLTHGSDNVVVYSKLSGFSRVEFGVSRLERVHEVVFIEMVSKSVFNKSFCKFG